MAFLTTRVKKPDEDDWGKLRRCLSYLEGTMYVKLTLEVNDLRVIEWWVDASYTTHDDFKGHSGGMMSLGKGATTSASNKQKINVGSSTEGEIVGTHDFLGKIMWAKYFIEAQGYTVDQNIVYQDNQATLRLMTNGRLSSTKRTKHIHARYFLVKDYIERGEIKAVHCPPEGMWADVLNKPKQGASFRRDRGHLMNVPTDYDNEIERSRTHPKLLTFEKEGVQDAPAKSRTVLKGALPVQHRKSVLGRPRIGAPHRAPNMRRALNPRPRDIRPIPGVMADSERVRTKVRMGRGRARGRGARPAQQ